MGRAKLNMKLIENEKTRNSTFQKRKSSMKKKIHELSTLCGIDVGLIIYGPKQNNEPLELEIWPANRDSEILQLINKYKAQSPEVRKKRTSNLGAYFVDRKNKAQNELAKLRKTNNQARYPTWDHRYNDLLVDQLWKISSILEMKLNDAKIRHYYYAYFVQQQQLWQQEQQCLFNNFWNKINSHEPFDQPYNYQLQQQGISTFDHHTNLTPINQHKPFDQPYNYQMQQQGYSTSDHGRNLIPNSRMITSINDNDYIEGASNSRNVVYGPTFKVEPGVYNEPIKAGMVESIGIVNNLIRAPEMCYYGEAMPPMPQYNMEYPIWASGGAMTDQIHDFSEVDDHNFGQNLDYDLKNLK